MIHSKGFTGFTHLETDETPGSEKVQLVVAAPLATKTAECGRVAGDDSHWAKTSLSDSFRPSSV